MWLVAVMLDFSSLVVSKRLHWGMALGPRSEEFCMLSKWERTFQAEGVASRAKTWRQKSRLPRRPFWQKHKLCGRHVLAKAWKDRLENLQWQEWIRRLLAGGNSCRILSRKWFIRSFKNGSDLWDMKRAEGNRLKAMGSGETGWEACCRRRTRNSSRSLSSPAFLRSAGCCVTHFLLKLV